MISRGWTLLASHSHPVTVSRSRRGLCPAQFWPRSSGNVTATSSTAMLSTMEDSECRLRSSAASSARR